MDETRYALCSYCSSAAYCENHWGVSCVYEALSVEQARHAILEELETEPPCYHCAHRDDCEFGDTDPEVEAECHYGDDTPADVVRAIIHKEIRELDLEEDCQ